MEQEMCWMFKGRYRNLIKGIFFMIETIFLSSEERVNQDQRINLFPKMIPVNKHNILLCFKHSILRQPSSLVRKSMWERMSQTISIEISECELSEINDNLDMEIPSFVKICCREDYKYFMLIYKRIDDDLERGEVKIITNSSRVMYKAATAFQKCGWNLQ